MENIGKAFTYMFEDENWFTKIIVGAFFTLLSSFIVGYPFVLGYQLEVLRNVRDGQVRPLPDWTDLGDKFTKGLILLVGLLIWAIPGIIIYGFGTVAAALSDPRGGAAFVGASLLLTCLGGLYFLFFAVAVPAIMIKFAEDPEFGSMFRFADIFDHITANIGNYIVVFLLAIVAYIIAYFGLILFCVGIIVTSFWAYLVQAHLYGQLARASRPSSGTLEV